MSKRLHLIVKAVHALILSKDVVIQNMLGFLAARASILAGLHPFGPALYIAMLAGAGRKSAVAIGISMILGTATVAESDKTIAFIAGALISLLLVKPPIKAEKLSERAIPLATLAFGVSGALRVWWEGYTEFAMIGVAVETFLAGLLALLLMPLATFRWFRSLHVLDKRLWVALALLASVAGLGLQSFEWGWVRPVEVWVRWVTMVAAFVGSTGAGAGVGTLFGVLIALAGSAPLGGTGLYAVAGLFAGLASRRGKVGVALGFILGQFLVSFLAQSADEITLSLAHTSFALIVLLLTPQSWLARLSRLVPGSEAQTAQRLAREERLTKAVNERLHQLSLLFNELAAVFAGPTAATREPLTHGDALHGLAERVWEAECAACPGFQACWREAGYHTYWDLVDLVTVADEKGSQVTVNDLPAGLAARCHRQREFVRAVNASLAGREAHKSAVVERRELVPRQLRGVAELLEDTARCVRIETGRSEEIEAYFREEPGLRRVDGVDLSVIRTGPPPEIEIEYSGRCDGYGECVEQFPPIIERLTGSRYQGKAVCRRKGESVCRIRLSPIPPFEVRAEAVTLAKEQRNVSGDSYARFDLGDGRVALMISDGMGTGERAAFESRAAIGLLEKMIKAGFDRSFAAQTVNAALLMSSPEESFTTVDLAMIDPFTGETEFLKGGSSPTFIKRRMGVEVIRSDSLPVGILREADVRSEQRLLGPDDVLVMVTDGLLDLLPPRTDKEEWMVRFLKQVETKDPLDLAERLVEKARQEGEGGSKDDVTVVVARLIRRPAKEGEIPTYFRAMAR